MASEPLRRTEPARPVDPEERRRHLRVVRARERAWRGFRLTPRIGIGVTVGLFVALFAVAASHALLIESQGRLDRLEQRVDEEQAQYEELRAIGTGLESPDRIVEEAEDRGMVATGERDSLVQNQPVAADEPEPVLSSPSPTDMKPYMEDTP